MSGIVRLAAGIEAELARRLPRQRKTQRGKLALLVATMLSERSASLMDLAAALPRPAERTDMRCQWIARLLANPRLDGDAVMQPFAEAAILHAGAAGGTVVLILDQSKVSAASGADAGRAGGRAGLAPGVAGPRDSGRHRVHRAAGAAHRGRELAARRHQDRAHGRPLLRQPRPDRLVPQAGLGLAPAAQAGTFGLRGRRRDHAGRVLRGWPAHA